MEHAVLRCASKAMMKLSEQQKKSELLWSQQGSSMGPGLSLMEDQERSPLSTHASFIQ